MPWHEARDEQEYIHNTTGRDPEAGVAWGLFVPTMSLAGGALVVRLVTRRRGMPKQLCAVRSVVASFLLRFWHFLHVFRGSGAIFENGRLGSI